MVLRQAKSERADESGEGGSAASERASEQTHEREGSPRAHTPEQRQRVATSLTGEPGVLLCGS